VLGLLIGTVHLLLVLNAAVRSVATKWMLGTFAGIARTFLLIAVAIAGARIRTGAEPTASMNVALYAGPLLTVAVLGFAWLRRRRIAAGSEAEAPADMLVRAWLLAAIMDGLFAAVNIVRTTLA
jgi:uncharacterized protein (TIGR03382 family)